MGTATTVTTTEDGITVAYLSSDENGQQYITVSGDGVDGETVALVHSEEMEETPMVQDADGMVEKEMEEAMMEN